MMAMVAEPMSISALSTLTGMDRRTIGKRLEGLEPAAVKSRAKCYATADALKAIYLGGDTGEALDLQQESARLKKAQADKTEREVAILDGDLMKFSDVKSRWADMVTAARAKLLALPGKLAVRVTGLDHREAESEARELIFEALGALANDGRGDKSGGPGPVDGRSDGDVDAAAGSDGQRVGGRKSGSVKRGKRRTRKVAD